MKNKKITTTKECTLDFIKTIVRVYFCPSKIFKERIMEKLGITFGEDRRGFEFYAGFTVVQPQYIEVNGQDKFCWVIWIDSDNLKKVQGEFLTHEITHVVCEIMRYFEFDIGDDELRAYLTQYLMKNLIEV